MTIPQFYPYLNVPNNITNSYPAVITLAIPVTYIVDQMVSIRCPLSCGMSQINNKTVKIISVDALANTITIDLDTTQFDPFVYLPFPQVPFTLPAGEIGTLGAAVRDNTSRPGYTRIGP